MGKSKSKGLATVEPEKKPLPDPAIRIRAGAAGTPVVLADGREWMLADGGLGNDLDEIRDRLFDDTIRGSKVKLGDDYAAAAMLLHANYDIDQREFLDLVKGVDPKVIMDAVWAAMFGHETESRYTAWALSSLIANGIDPAKVPTSLRDFVLSNLVATGRAIPQDQFVESISRRDLMNSLRARAKKAQ